MSSVAHLFSAFASTILHIKVWEVLFVKAKTTTPVIHFSKVRHKHQCVLMSLTLYIRYILYKYNQRVNKQSIIITIFFCSAGGRTPGHLHARQALCYWAFTNPANNVYLGNIFSNIAKNHTLFIEDIWLCLHAYSITK
jgi:hypothetical protein